MPISIRDVAAQAGVSKSTVSQVLNGNLDARISKDTQDRVRRIAMELGYRPNRMAQNLGRRRTNTIGLVFSGFRNPFFVELVEAAEQLIIDAGYQTLIDAAPSHAGTYVEHGRLSGWAVDGVLMWALSYEKLSHYIGSHADELPVVYVGQPERSDNADVVGHDLYVGARQACEHVIRSGYRRIAHLTPSYFTDWQHPEDRYRAYQDVCREAGLPLETILLDEPGETRALGRVAGLRIAARPASQRPDVILCFNDVIAVGLIHGLRRGGLHVPGDIGVVGFDGIEEGQELDTPLTTVQIPVAQMCRHALNILLQRINNNSGPEAQRVVVSTELRVGETTRCL